MFTYDLNHWEQLIDTIIERLGVERFVEIAVYVLEQRGYDPGALRRLAGEYEGSGRLRE